MPTPTESALPAKLAVIPPFPPIATRLLGMLGREGVEIKDLADLISSDPMFTGRILQFANSAEFGLLQPIRNVRQGLVTLGLDRTRRVTIAAAAGVYSRVALKTAELRRCWRHTVATATMADEIGRRCHAFTETAYAAGIMHDIGRLGLLAAYPAEYEKTMRDAAARCIDLLDYEREVFGVDHAEAGRLLSLRWKLPEEFQVITGRHHDTCEGTDLDLLRIVHVACRLADYFGYDVTRPLTQLQYEEVIAELPEPFQPRLINATDQLRKAIRKGVRAFDGGDDEPEDPKAEWSKIRDNVLHEEAPKELLETETPDTNATVAKLAHDPSFVDRLLLLLRRLLGGG